MTTTVAETVRSNNTLTHPEFFRAARWVEDNQASLKGLTQPQAAELVAAGTGITITSTNIRAMAAATGITIGRVVKPKTAQASTQDSIRTLARSLEDLYESLAQPVPASLQALASR